MGQKQQVKSLDFESACNEVYESFSKNKSDNSSISVGTIVDDNGRIGHVTITITDTKRTIPKP